MDNPRTQAGRFGMYISTPEITELVTAEQYYDVAGTFTAVGIKNFTVSESGLVTYAGPNVCFLINGNSDIEVNKACRITYSIKFNGVVQTFPTTPHDFAASSKIGGIGTTRVVELTAGDTLQISAKSSVANTDMTANTLFLTFWN